MVKMTEEDPDYEGPWATKDNSMTIDNLREHLRLGGMCAAIDDVRSLMTAHDALAERAADADRDYADMRRFQGLYIEADLLLRALRAENERQRGLLLWALYHAQGGSSAVGQPIRKALGIGKFDHLTPEQVRDAALAAQA